MSADDRSPSNLPFDQFSRQKIVQTLINEAIRPLLGGKDLACIDLGGHKGHTKDFLPNDRLTILDVFDESYPGYIKGDATKTSFSDGQFDIALSFDTLEHIPRKNRQAFVKEASRISRQCLIIAAPFDNEWGIDTVAEKAANEIYKAANGEDHIWLKEHLELGTPKKSEMEKYLQAAGLDWASIPTNNLWLWFETQSLMFNATYFEADVKEVVDVSRYYNDNIYDLESLTGTTYRSIYIASSNKNLLSAVASKAKEIKNGLHETDGTVIRYLAEIGKAYGAMLGRLTQDVRYLKDRERHLQTEYDKLAAEYNLLLAKITQTSSPKKYGFHHRPNKDNG